jgi:hypothetical protein
MDSLVLALQKDALDNTVTLLSLLRKALVVAKKLYIQDKRGENEIENEIENQIEFHHLNILESVAKGSLDVNDALKQLEGAVPTKIDGQAQ